MIEKILLYILELTGLVEITAYKNVFLFWDPKIITNLTLFKQLLPLVRFTDDSKNVILLNYRLFEELLSASRRSFVGLAGILLDELFGSF